MSLLVHSKQENFKFSLSSYEGKPVTSVSIGMHSKQENLKACLSPYAPLHNAQ
jgi:hypothetical protein